MAPLTLLVVLLLGGRQLVGRCYCCQHTLAWIGEFIQTDNRNQYSTILGCEEGRKQSTYQAASKVCA